MEEIDIGKLTVVKNANLQDFVLMFTKSGALVIIPVENLRQKTDGKIAPTADIITASGIQSLPNNTAILQNSVGDGVSVGMDGSISILPGASNKITLGNANTVIEPALLTKATADGSYMPVGNLVIRVSQTPNQFADGNPARWNGTAWVKPGPPGVIPAGETSPADDWSGIVRWVDANTFDLIVAGYVSLTPGAPGSPTPTQFVPGTNYWDATLNNNAGGWTTIKPRVFGAFDGKVVAKTSTSGIILPFKRRSTGFRPLSSLPAGAGRINAIAVDGLPTNHVLCATQAGSAVAGVYVSTDGGVGWGTGSRFNAPSPFNSITDVAVGAIRTSVGGGATENRIAVSLGFSGTPPAGAARAWVYSALNNNAYTFTSVDPGWGSTATTNLNNIATANGYWWTFHTLGGGSNNVARGVPGDFLTNWALGDATPLQSIVVGGDVYVAGGDATIRKASTTGAGAVTITSITHSTFTGELINRIACNGTIMIAVTASSKILKSDNFSVASPTFVATPAGGPAVINDLIHVATVGWFAASNDGIYISTSDADNWNKIYDSNGIAVTALASSGTKVYAGTADAKILLFGG